MASEASGPDGAYTRPVRILLVVCCLLALVLAGGLIPSLTSGVGSPAESLVPGEALSSGEGSGSTAASGGAGTGGFGALNPGSSTEVGGDTGVGDRNPFQSQSNAVHFSVTSPRPAYWRTGAYDRYTGTGWAQTGTAEPLSGTIEGEGIQGPRTEYEVTLNRTATALPTVWRPNGIVGRSDLSVTDQRAIRAQQPLEPGETYVGVSHRPPQDPTLLKTADSDYPAAIADRYATLPEDVPDRVGLFTDELTGGDETPYQKAVTIEQWLESDKTYSLDAARTSEQMADTFIFEMDRGYCEYFATSMVVMLRSQEIPARYVIGYSTGQRSGNTYTVRAMNAHAWVEVYFEDVGWVKFDPTPGSARLQAEQQSLQEQDPDAEYSPEEQGSPGESFTPEGETTPTPTATPTPDDGTDEPDAPDDDDDQSASEYDISLNRTAVPGAAVEVSVSRGGEPAADVTVLFNGNPVGVTDRQGTVVATVPYASELRVAVDDGSAASLDPPGQLPDSSGRFYSVPPPATDPRDVTVPVETNASVTVSGDRVPGGTVTVTAVVADVPVRGAAVTVDGDRVATTDDGGRASVTLPSAPGNVTVAIERDPIAGETTVRLPALNVSVAPSLPLALPLTGATVAVTADGTPVSGVPVRLDGKQVGTTGIDGTASLQLPAASSATVSVRALGQTRTATLSGLFLNFGLATLALGLVVALPLVVARRRGYSPRDIADVLRRLPGRLLQSTQWLLVALATRGGDLLRRLVVRLRRTVEHLRDLLRGSVRPAALWAALLDWLAARRAELTNRGEADDDRPATQPGSEAQRSIRAAWERFLDHVSLRTYRTKTPGEIARHAVDRDDLPAEPVRVLRDAFREVEYGARSASDRLDRVERAVTAIEREDDTDADDEQSGASGGRR